MKKIRLGIATRLQIGFGFLLILMASLTFLSVAEVNAISEDLNQINTVNSVKQRYAINFRGSVHDRAIAVRDVVLLDGAADQQKAIGLINKLADAYSENERLLDAMMAKPNGASAAEKAIAAEIAAVQARTNPLVAQVIAAREQGDAATAKARLIESSALFDDWLRAINKFIDHQEALSKAVGDGVDRSAHGFQTLALIALTLAAFLAVGTGLLVGRSITVPVRKLASAMRRLAASEALTEIPGEARGDEIGEMARAVVVFRDNDGERRRLEGEAARERDRERQRQAHLDGMIERFREIISGALASVGDGTKAMRETAGALTSAAGTAVGRADAARSASTTAASEVQSVATAAEQLSASIREIAEQAQRASTVVQRASTVAQRTNGRVEGLSEAAERIGAIVDMIRTIADQTNLLALNATIEAARAGEAGKGFAVVAAEVKTLASQTAKATADISAQINAVQGSTRESVEAIREIGGAVHDIESFMQAIAAAVEEQDAATKEISHSISVASRGSVEATANVDSVAAAIADTSGEARNVLGVSTKLSQVAAELSSAVDDFLAGVAAGSVDQRVAGRVAR